MWRTWGIEHPVEAVNCRMASPAEPHASTATPSAEDDSDMPLPDSDLLQRSRMTSPPGVRIEVVMLFNRLMLKQDNYPETIAGRCRPGPFRNATGSA